MLAPKKFLLKRNKFYILASRLKVNILSLLKLIISIIYFPIAIVCLVNKIKFLPVNIKRLGHLVTDINLQVKLKKIHNYQYKIVVIKKSNNFANDHLLNYQRRDVTFIQSSLLNYLLMPLTWNRYTALSGNETVSKKSSLYGLMSRDHKNAPSYELTEADIEYGKDFLTKLGLRKDQWFVCIHARTSNYSITREGRDYGQSFRNNDIRRYKLAIEEIYKEGGVCIRTGDESMEKIEETPYLFDYANSSLRNPRLDVYLFASCKFLLTPICGVVDLANLFGVPAAINNIAPLSHCPIGIEKNICIPKLHSKEDEIIKFKEIFNSEISDFKTNREFAEHGIDLIENSEEDILLLTKDMMTRLKNGGEVLKKDKNLNKEYFSLIKNYHFNYNSRAMVSSSFLNKYLYLLD